MNMLAQFVINTNSSIMFFEIPTKMSIHELFPFSNFFSNFFSQCHRFSNIFFGHLFLAALILVLGQIVRPRKKIKIFLKSATTNQYFELPMTRGHNMVDKAAAFFVG